MKQMSDAWFVPLLVAATAVSLSAQQTPYLTVNGIKGNQTGLVHVGQFKLTGFENAGTNPAIVGGVTGLSAGKVSFSKIRVSLPLDPPTMGLFWMRMAQGTHIPSAEIGVYDSADKLFYKIELNDVMVDAISTSGADGVNASIDFVFGRIKWWGASPTAPTQFVVIGSWDVTKNVIW